MFVENVIFIMKNILENKADQPNDQLGITSIENLMLAIVRLVATSTTCIQFYFPTIHLFSHVGQLNSGIYALHTFFVCAGM